MIRQMDRSIYEKESFYDNEQDTKLICSECNKGTLLLLKKNLSTVEYKTFNLSAYTHPASEIDWFKYGFMGILICSICKEEIVFSGKATQTEYYQQDYDGTAENFLRFELFPEYFERTPYIIPILEQYPESIKESLIKSFKLFWIDLEACANKIRVSLEHLMNHLKIKKESLNNKGKVSQLSLHSRIELLADKAKPGTDNHLKFNDIMSHLLAVKWIGNAGSHITGLNRSDILDAYEILDYTLEKLFSGKEEKLRKMTNSINKRKKPLSK